MTELTIRPALPAEAEALGELAAATFPLACPPGTEAHDIADFIATNLTPAHFAKHLSDPLAHITVATDGTTLLGYSLVLGGEVALPDPGNKITGSPTWYLSKLYARQEAHGSGIAAKLVGAAATFVKENGGQSMWLATNVHNHRAVKFYRKHGFIQRGEKIFMVGAGAHHDYTFELMLDR